jgi:hypothetical protein
MHIYIGFIFTGRSLFALRHLETKGNGISPKRTGSTAPSITIDNIASTHISEGHPAKNGFDSIFGMVNKSIAGCPTVGFPSVNRSVQALCTPVGYRA